MQQPATEASYPVGQVVDPPPKQRGMPDESSLQTAFFPSQQSWDAGMCPPSGSTGAPQVAPGGLQACPLSQRIPSCGSQVTDAVVDPPQQSCVSLHQSPVTRHPVAATHTAAPVPRSRHRPVQQRPPVSAHGFPSWMQPPLGSTQRDTPVAGSASQVWPQQSSSEAQRSPLALQALAATQVPAVEPAAP